MLAGADLVVNVRFEQVSHEQAAEKNFKSKQNPKSTWCWTTPFVHVSCLRQHAESTTGTGTKPRNHFDVVSLMSEADEQYVRTVDGQDVPSEQAHRLCQKIFYAGFAGLPWLWFVNVWLFWPDLRHGHDLTVQKYARWSATGFGLITVLLLAWIAAFSIGQGKLVGSNFFEEWNLANIDPGDLQA